MNFIPMKTKVCFTAFLLMSQLNHANAKNLGIEFEVESNDTITLRAKQGMFSVSAWDQDVIKVLGQVNSDVYSERDGATIIVTLNSLNASSADDALTIKVPVGHKLSVSGGNADFSFDGLNPQKAEAGRLNHKQSSNSSEPDISVVSVDGDITITNSSGDFNINTINGKIKISDSRGAANIRSISGSQDVKADFRNLSSSNVSGQSMYTLRTLEKLHLSNVNGDSSVESSLSPGASIQMQSVNGDLRLLVPQVTSADFLIESHKGGIIKNSLSGTADANDAAQEFSLGDASASVTMNTMGGHIELAPQLAKSAESSEQGEVDFDFDWSSVDTSILDFAYINPSYSAHDFKKIYIKPAEVHFDPQWLARFSKKLNSSYRERVMVNYAKLLEKAIKDKFSKNDRFEIVDERANDVLVIIPKVVDLYIDRIESVELKDSLVVTPAGSAKIDLIAYSIKDSSVLGFFMDKRGTSVSNILGGSNARAANQKAFFRLFSDWAEDIITVLEK